MRLITKILNVLLIFFSSLEVEAKEPRVIEDAIPLDQLLFDSKSFFNKYLSVHGYLVDISLTPDMAIYALVRNDEYAGFQDRIIREFSVELSLKAVDFGAKVPSVDKCLNSYVSVIGFTDEHTLKGGILVIKDVSGIFQISKNISEPVCWLSEGEE